MNEFRTQPLRHYDVIVSVSGDVITKQTKLYKGSYGFTLLRLYVPITQIHNPNENTPIANVYKTTIDGEGIEKIDGYAYPLFFVETVKIGDYDYFLFESPMPQVFTSTVGKLYMTFVYKETNGDSTLGAITTKKIEETVYEGGETSFDLDIPNQFQTRLEQLQTELTYLGKLIDDRKINLNLQNGSGLGSVKSTEETSEYGVLSNTTASGFQSFSFGGKRYDRPEAPESINEGSQSILAGGSLRNYSDFSANFGKQNIIYANAGFAAGGGNIVGTEEDVNGAQGAYSLGMSGKSSGQGSGTLGVGNTSTAYGSIAGGSSNEVHANGAIGLGTRHVINAGSSASFLGGEYNIVAENCPRACGLGYTLQLNAPDAIGIGSQNTVNGQRGIGMGYLSTVNSMDAYTLGVNCIANNRFSFAGGNGSVTNNGGAFLYGYKLKSAKSYQTIFGIRNALTEARFVIAAGNEDDNNPVEKNVFAVYDDGRAKVYGAPKEDNDAVRWLEVKNKLDKLEGDLYKSKLYGTNYLGNFAMRQIGEGRLYTNNGSIAMYVNPSAVGWTAEPYGSLFVHTPLQPWAATPKNYIDERTSWKDLWFQFEQQEFDWEFDIPEGSYKLSMRIHNPFGFNIKFCMREWESEELWDDATIDNFAGFDNMSYYSAENDYQVGYYSGASTVYTFEDVDGETGTFSSYFLDGFFASDSKPFIRVFIPNWEDWQENMEFGETPSISIEYKLEEVIYDEQ